MPKTEPQNEFNLNGLFDEVFSKKLPFLLVALVFFLLSLYTFFNSGITFSSLFDFGKFAGDPTNLFSMPLILFTLIFSIALSLTSFFGFGLKTEQAVAPLAIYLLVALASFAFLPSYAPAFILFAITFGAGAIVASMQKEVNWTAFSNATRRALTVFLIVAILFSVVKIELNKDGYLDGFLMGAASLSPQLAKQVLPLCSQSFSKVDPEEVVPRALSDTQAASTYAQYSALIAQSSTCTDIPEFSQLNASVQTELRDAQHSTTVQSVKQLLSGLTEQLNSPAFQAQLANFRTSKKELNELRNQLRQISYFQLVETYFSIFIAFILFSILSAFTWIAKIICYPLNYALLQLNKVKIEAKE